MDVDTLLHQGEALYEQNCAQCHYAGEGNPQVPSLIGSASVNKSAENLLQIILRGQAGVSMKDGKKIMGVMPAQDYLNDVEIAAVATYVRREFGQVKEPVQPSLVAKIRALP
jgi:mono/diheme cytochrome c family protein